MTAAAARSSPGPAPKRPLAGAQRWVPPDADVSTLARAAADCRGCELHEQATGTVFGAGPAPARLMLVGEQPGDQEDRTGTPFVGPAGQVLHRALRAAGLDITTAWITNAVKHFHHVERGKRRLHRTPQARHISACRPWLAAEIVAVRPRLVVVLGATAGRSFYGPGFRVGPARGVLQPWPDTFEAGDPAAQVLVTVHPSAVLRAPDREAAFADLVADLKPALDVLS
ncbi:MAG TPA: UdgX family uracil-DNA binding protein [Sporichthyaceae bacterium]|nr:UdgX family uracil-DNA binding protein [Sporichthyaceae bacterium]